MHEFEDPDIEFLVLIPLIKRSAGVYPQYCKHCDAIQLVFKSDGIWSIKKRPATPDCDTKYALDVMES